MVKLRPYRDGDLEALYAISLATGLSGKDASASYQDPKLMGHLYSAPYAVLLPALCHVVEDGEGVCGFIVGATDTIGFEERLEREWWPHLRNQYAEPSGTPSPEWTPDQHRIFTIHHPRRTPREIADLYPAHLHMNLLSRIQGKGIGRALLTGWLSQARVAGVHIGCNPHNHGAIAFWEKQHFRRLVDLSGGRTIWLGRKIGG